jgi:ABC-type multidrug transport system ATPase subunit
MHDQVVVRAEGLIRRFSTGTVIGPIDLELRRGEAVALHGPNGSGKSTILRCLAGTLSATAGTISIAGLPPGTFAARQLVGVSFAQERSFYLRLTGRDNLLMFARFRYPNTKQAAEAVSALEEELQLTTILETRVDRCSTGMTQQLAFARALLGEPLVLLLDEPTRSLDDEAVERVWAAVRRRPQAATLLASHLEDDVTRSDGVVELAS